jgi:hypothetical protein
MLQMQCQQLKNSAANIKQQIVSTSWWEDHQQQEVASRSSATSLNMYKLFCHQPTGDEENIIAAQQSGRIATDCNLQQQQEQQAAPSSDAHTLEHVPSVAIAPSKVTYSTRTAPGGQWGHAVASDRDRCSECPQDRTEQAEQAIQELEDLAFAVACNHCCLSVGPVCCCFLLLANLCPAAATARAFRHPFEAVLCQWTTVQ